MTLGSGRYTIAACYVCRPPTLAGALLNIALFVPFGAALAAVRPGGLTPLLAGAALSSLVELVQLVLPDRQASPLDVAANTAGALLGMLLVRSAPRWLESGPANRHRLALASAAVALGTHAAATVLLGPAFPATRYFAQLAPRLGHLAPWPAAIRAAALGDIQLADGPMQDGAAARRLLEGDAPLTVTTSWLAPPEGLAPVVSLADARPDGLVLLGVEGRDLVFQRRTRAAALTMRQPDMRWPGALRRAMPGDSLLLAATRERGGWCLRAGDAARCGLRPTAGEGWAVLLGPWRGPAWLGPLVAALWVAIVSLPTGFFASGTAGMLLAAAVVSFPVLAALAPWMGVSLAEPAGGLAGIALGFLLRRARSRSGASLRAGMRHA